ncbi:MAG: DUF1444 family protein [Clostridia bacterium]|jgi:uncharacterized protein YtpQ (UPF0354 family)
MLTIADFSRKIIFDLNKTFPIARVQGKYVIVESNPNSVSIPVSSIYKEYQETKDYGKTLASYIKIINDILSQYKFKIDYNNVFPLLKSRDFGKGEKDLGFYREHAFADVDIFYASDIGEVFRFILFSDDVDFEKMKKAAWKNLNKLSNILVRLDDALNLYCLRYTTDFNASFLLSDSIQKQILKKVGRDYIFAIPSSTTLIVARYCLEYIKIIESLIMIDKDPNRISGKVYRCKNGIFDIVD